MILFEVFLTKEGVGKPVLSDEIRKSSGAAVMTPAEAELVGLQGIPDDPEGRDRVLIACSPGDQRLIQSRLEANEGVATFKLHKMG